MDIIVNPEDDPEERDQFLESVQAVYLHGRLPCSPEDLIFSRGQYARSSLVQLPLYEQFIREYSTFCTVFVGTSFDEDLAWQYIEQRKGRPRKINEHRPKSFLIDPEIDPIQSRLLEQYNIKPIPFSVDDFLTWLSEHQQKLPSRSSLLSEKFPLLNEFSRWQVSPRYSGAIRDFSSTFISLSHKEGFPDRSLYLLGASPSWNDLNNGLDAPRSMTNTIFKDVMDRLSSATPLSLLVLLGSGGAGKSTILRRLGLDLVRAGKKVFFTDAQELPRPSSIANALIGFDDSIILLFDNADVTLRELPHLISEFAHVEKPLVVVVAARTNDYDRLTGKFDDSVNFTEHRIRRLEREEIVNIIGILEDHGNARQASGYGADGTHP